MEKDWFKSKAVWSGVAIMAMALLKVFQEYSAGTGVDLQSFISSAGQGLGILGIRFAIK